MSAIKEAMTDKQRLEQQHTENFKKFEFYTGNNINRRYSTIELLPSICLVIDNQMNETWIYHDNEDNSVFYPSKIAVSIILNWLGFYLDFILYFKTDKHLEKKT